MTTLYAIDGAILASTILICAGVIAAYMELRKANGTLLRLLAEEEATGEADIDALRNALTGPPEFIGYGPAEPARPTAAESLIAKAKQSKTLAPPALPASAPELAVRLWLSQFHPNAAMSDVITGPPRTARGDDTRDWLQYHTRDQYAWPEAVAMFYDEAADDAQVYDYFSAMSLTMEELQRHFTHAMKILTSDGLTPRLLLSMANRHAHIRNSYGEPITGVIYDRVIQVLVAILTDAKVPAQAIAELGQIAAPLRIAIVQREA